MQRVIGEVGAGLGRPDLALDDDACAELRLGGRAVTLMHSTEPAELLWLYVDLGPAPDDPERLRMLLRLGFLGWAAGQMTLGLDRDGRRLIGYAVVPVAALTPDTLREALERLLARAAELAERLACCDLAFDAGPPIGPPGASAPQRA